jgi:RNA polymerase sigma factor (sigma-70 family)
MKDSLSNLDRAEYLYSINYKNLFKYFHYRYFNPSDTEDACQEIFERFFRLYGRKVHTDSEVSRVLYGIAWNVHREFLRTISRHNHLELFDTDLPEDGEWQQVVEECEELDPTVLLEKLEQAIQRLSPILQQVIRLRFFEDKSRAEVATVLNLKEKQVHVYQRRALTYMQRYLSRPIVSPHT